METLYWITFGERWLIWWITFGERWYGSHGIAKEVFDTIFFITIAGA